MMTLRAAAAVIAALAAVAFITAPPAAADVTIFHWDRPVYVENHTGWSHAWRDEVARWQRWTVVDVRYGHCRSGAGCVRVWTENLGWNGGVSGQTEYVGGVSNGLIYSPVRIVVNSYYRCNWTTRHNKAAHELGHALGFYSHRYSTWAYYHSPMYYRMRSFDTYHIPDADRRLLNSGY